MMGNDSGVEEGPEHHGDHEGGKDVAKRKGWSGCMFL
jgi:hypothetical protein